ncbi:hypothetical protein NQD34_001300 [Periophthalmus magnuspinnatus]|nr:hypothetical protein NQD34_001300 [Periophthalmus magnuspinnatus]
MMALNRVSLLCHEVTRLWLQLKICTDDLLQDVEPPLCAAHIGSELQRQFAFRPGGRGLSGGPIIIFPEFPDFHEIQEEELHNVLPTSPLYTAWRLVDWASSWSSTDDWTDGPRSRARCYGSAVRDKIHTIYMQPCGLDLV